MFETIKTKVTQTYNNAKEWTKKHPTETKVIAIGAAAVGVLGVVALKKRGVKTVEAVDTVKELASEAPVLLDIPTIDNVIEEGGEYRNALDVAKHTITQKFAENGLSNVSLSSFEFFDVYASPQPMLEIIANDVDLANLGDFGKALAESGCFDPKYSVSMIINETTCKL